MRRSQVIIVTPRDHARYWHLLDELAQLRHKIFVEQLGWHLPMAADGREIDEWDDHRATYIVLLSHGTIRAAIRLHSTDAPTLLTQVFPHLADGPLPTGADVWEGTRMLAHPDLGADTTMALQELLCAAVSYGLTQGVTKFVSVSDPILERILRRSGAEPRRLGRVHEVQPGVKAVALEMACTPAVLEQLERRLDTSVPALPRAA